MFPNIYIYIYIERERGFSIVNACWIYDVDLYIGINMLVGATDIDPKKTIEFESKSINLNDNMLTYNSNQNKATC